jgi:hypothetical protein
MQEGIRDVSRLRQINGEYKKQSQQARLPI